ncbi:MAG: PD40 domain-containing protein [Verrucomicrobiales bacterium]|nr:PD40 domain-containing protein [Verrucomicrobiales bacterium]
MNGFGFLTTSLRLGPRLCHAFALAIALAAQRSPAESPAPTATLAAELQSRGWIVSSAQTPRGDWDLFLMRPDGSQRRALIETPEFNEAGARFSPDGHRLLYYRMPKGEALDNNTYGTFDLVLADSNGQHAVVLGRGFPWATWGPDGREIACLQPKGIQILDPRDRRVLRTLPRQGIVEQLIWSPDGTAFTGTANGLGPFWNIGLLPHGDGTIRAVSETDRYNCTPDWLPDGQHIVYARGIIPQQPGRAELWMATVKTQTRTMLYAESTRHIYGACASPDGKYLLFTRSVADLGAVGQSQTTMAVLRRSDTPMLGDDSPALRREYPHANPPRWIDLGPGWEPHWTYSEAPATP